MLKSAFEQFIGPQQDVKLEPERICMTKSGIAFDITLEAAKRFKPAASTRCTPTFERLHSREFEECHNEVESRRLKLEEERVSKLMLTVEQALAARAWARNNAPYAYDNQKPIDSRPAFPRNQQSYKDSISYKLPVQLLINKICQEKRNLAKQCTLRNQIESPRAKDLAATADRLVQRARQVMVKPCNPTELKTIEAELTVMAKAFEPYTEKPAMRSGRSSVVTSPRSKMAMTSPRSKMD